MNIAKTTVYETWFRYQHMELVRLVATSITVPADINQPYTPKLALESGLAAVRRPMAGTKMQYVDTMAPNIPTA